MINKYYKSSRVQSIFISLMLVLVFSCLIQAQNTNNPFEIKNRILEIDKKVDTSVHTNFFEETQDTIESIEDQNNIPDIIAPVENAISKVNDSGKNPFEVNHIPLRRKDVLKQIENVPEAESNPRNVKPASKGFIYWIIIASMILLTLASSSKKDLLPKVTKSIFNENILKFEQRTRTVLSLEYLLLYVIFLVNAAVFLMLLWNHFGSGEIRFFSFMQCLGFVTALYLLRHFSIYLFGIIFPLEKEATLYNFTIQIFNAFIGIVLIPINLFLAFGPDNFHKFTLLFGLGIVCILLIIRYMRGIVISINYIFSNFILFFIYLCTLEIAPILILVKLFNNYLFV